MQGSLALLVLAVPAFAGVRTVAPSGADHAQISAAIAAGLATVRMERCADFALSRCSLGGAPGPAPATIAGCARPAARSPSTMRRSSAIPACPAPGPVRPAGGSRVLTSSTCAREGRAATFGLRGVPGERVFLFLSNGAGQSWTTASRARSWCA